MSKIHRASGASKAYQLASASYVRVKKFYLYLRVYAQRAEMIFSQTETSRIAQAGHSSEPCSNFCFASLCYPAASIVYEAVFHAT